MKYELSKEEEHKYKAIEAREGIEIKDLRLYKKRDAEGTSSAILALALTAIIGCIIGYQLGHQDGYQLMRTACTAIQNATVIFGG